MNKEQTVGWLVANCDCWKGQQGHETLNKLQDDQLAKLKAAAEKAKADELVANKAREPQTLPDGSSLVWNAEKQTWEHKPKPAEVPKPAETPAASAVNRLTAEEQDDLAFARAERMRQKQAMIDRLTANVADAQAKAAAHAVYAAMKPEQLAPLVNALQAGTTQSQQQPLAYAPSWGGAVPPPVANAKDDSDNLLPPMVFDFEAEAEQRRKQLQKQA